MPKRDPTSDDPTLGSLDPADNPPIAFSDEDWGWLCANVSDLGLPAADAFRDRCEALYGHLVGVNRWLNLTTVADPRGWLKQHLLDSLTLLGDPRLQRLAEGTPCVDLGSGGGYPGLPLATWLPTIPWVLIDARKKKVDFLNAACPLTGNPHASARHVRGSQIRGQHHDLWRKCQVVTCRAMGQGDLVLEEAADLVRPHGHVVMSKGPSYVGEERDRTLAAAEKLGYRLVTERGLVLDEGEGERIIAVFCRER